MEILLLIVAVVVFLYFVPSFSVLRKWNDQARKGGNKRRFEQTPRETAGFGGRADVVARITKEEQAENQSQDQSKQDDALTQETIGGQRTNPSQSTKHEVSEVPTMDDFMRPILEYASQHSGSFALREITDAMADHFNLSPKARNELTGGGNIDRVYDRTSWSISHLKHAGFLRQTGRGRYEITDAGREEAKSSNEIGVSYLIKNVPAYQQWKQSRTSKKNHTTKDDASEAARYSGSRDFTKYEFNGTVYNKRKLVLAVIKDWIESNKPQNIENLMATFPQDIIFTGTFAAIDEADDARYFTNENDCIRFDDGSCYVISNQWGGEPHRRFVEIARELGYEIEEAEDYRIQGKRKDEKERAGRYSGMDSTKYIFKGKKYGKGRLVLAIIKDWIKSNQPQNIEELIDAFPQDIPPNRTFSLLDEAKRQHFNKGRKRYFINEIGEYEPIDFPDGTSYAVSSQWGINTITRFIEIARNLGYVIEEAE